MRKFMILGAILGLIGLTSPARADFVIQIAEDGGAFTTVASSSPGSSGTLTFSGTFGDFTILGGFSKSNSPGTLSGANLQVGTLDITNDALGSGSHTISIRVSAQGFTTPSGAGVGLVLADTVSGSVNAGTLSIGHFTGSIDTSNALFATGMSAPTITFGPTGSQNSFSGSSSTGVDIGTTPYSMTLNGDWRLSNGGELTLTGGNGKVVVPEPASMVLLALGGGLLGTFGLLRKREKKVG